MNKKIIRFLGSMDLAITLLVMLALASVIGTMVKQNEAWSDYELKFGPFWFRVYEQLSIYDVYSAPWFLLVLIFLLFSTSLCVWRNAPTFIKEMRTKYFNHAVDQLRLFKCRYECTGRPKHSLEYFKERLQAEGFKVRAQAKDDGTLLNANKGRYNRVGYLLTHLGVIIICVGALWDSSMILKWRHLTGQAVIETRSVPLSQIPETAWLENDHRAFRGFVNIPEGKSSDILFLPFKDGYFVQKLPFVVKVKDFTVEHYPTGQPKAFKSQLEIFDLDGQLRTTDTIRVNHPLTVDGVTIYQSSFADGGSQLKLQAWSLTDFSTQTIDVEVGRSLSLVQSQQTLEMDDFRVFNIQGGTDGTEAMNNGPSMIFKLRGADGQAKEFENYMLPINRDGRYFFLSGIRSSVAEAFQYWYMPADAKASPQRFMRFLALINDDAHLSGLLLDQTITDETIRKQRVFIVNLIKIFRQRGFVGITAYIDTIKDNKQGDFEEVVLDFLKFGLSTVYINQLEREEGIVPDLISEKDSLFFDDAVFAIAAMPQYSSPIFLQLKTFKQIQSSGLQMTRAPGQFIVYLGCVMLIIGVFILFYMRRVRIWLYWSEQKSLVAIEGIKNPLDRDNMLEKVKGWYNSA